MSTRLTIRTLHIDVGPAVSARQPLMAYLDRPQERTDRHSAYAGPRPTMSSCWWSLQVPVSAVSGGAEQWSLDRTSQKVRVPMFEYLVDATSQQLLTAAMQLGALAGNIRPPPGPTGESPGSLLLVLGDVYQDAAAGPTAAKYHIYAGLTYIEGDLQ